MQISPKKQYPSPVTHQKNAQLSEKTLLFICKKKNEKKLKKNEKDKWICYTFASKYTYMR